MKAICLEQVRKTYPQNKDNPVVLEEVDLTIDPGEFFFLLGPSGCGKSTLLKIIAGLVEPDSGKVLIAGRDVTRTPIEKRNCALVFQNYALWPHMTVQQNVEFGPRMQKQSNQLCSQIACKQLEMVEMTPYLGRKPNQLSGGQQQRVALARALAARPACLLLDEPLSNLDAKLRMQMRVELRKLVKSTGTTAIYVTHDQKEALAMADRIAVLENGGIVQIGSPAELYNTPKTRFVADFIGEANFIEGIVIECKPIITVKTSAGLLRSCQNASVVPGQHVTCCIRPERIHLSHTIEPVSQTASTILAKIDFAVHLGEIQQHQIILPDNALWKTTALSSTAIPQTKIINAIVKAEDVIIISNTPR